MKQALLKALGAHWRLFAAQGGVMVFLGVLALFAPAGATIAVDVYVGFLFLVSGVVGLVAVFSSKDIPAFLWSLVTAALSVIVGALLVWNPVEGALSLTLLLTALFIAEGIFQMVTSVAYREAMRGTWGWMLFSGIADLVLAALIILGWPLSAAWALGVVVGVNLITSGWAIVMAALAGREFAGSKAAGSDLAHTQGY